ncbi:hypothetical protein DES53_115136 [Roseimicrobium gellanilyticum]|uniref:Uncharacterized protein n=1 Tax=Roseimicrobium gellanilyticum TaxID=748857 RepID=A0A366H4Q5_9BACT|nr:hypothetical protein [Roseimicrobium gellanilyticum]RBP36995.1 hypothetical protein DES53_115136 [Roseimicrobium gellanilyticum]
MRNTPEEDADSRAERGRVGKAMVWMLATGVMLVVLYVLSAPMVEHRAMSAAPGGTFFSKRPEWLHRYLQLWDWLVRIRVLEGPMTQYQIWYYERVYDVQVEEVR